MMFDWDLFLKICKEHDVPLSSDHKVPMLEENGELRELTPDDVRKALLPAAETFAYTDKPYNFKESAPEKVELMEIDLLAA